MAVVLDNKEVRAESLIAAAVALAAREKK